MSFNVSGNERFVRLITTVLSGVSGLLASCWNRPFWPLVICLMLILLFAGLPVICIVISTTVANVLGCALDEGDVHPCPFLGVDIGGVLYDLAVSGWFGLITLPVGAILMMVWLVAVIAFTAKHVLARSGTH